MQSRFITEIANGVNDFLNSPAQLLILSGMFGQCMRDVVKLVNKTTANLHNKTSMKSTTIIAPSTRISNGYGFPNLSVYRFIYETRSFFHKKDEKFIHDIRSCNNDSSDHIYVVGDAHLISDTFWETSSRRFGSGHLLTDLIEFINVCKSERRIIFISDPFQLSKGSSTPTSITKLNEFSKPVKHVKILGFKCYMGSVLFQENREVIADRIQTHQYNRLSIKLDNEHCTQISDIPDEMYTLIKNKKATVVAYTNALVNQYNQMIRSHLFGVKPELCKGDLIVLHNSVTFWCEKTMREFTIANGSFGVITQIVGEDSIEQRLRGRKNPVKVNFLKVRISWNHLKCSHEQIHLCYKDFIYRDKPELEKDEFIALIVHAREKKKCEESQNQKYSESVQPDHELVVHCEHPEKDNSQKGEINIEREDLDSPYLRAAMLRFGYTITLHRAQGCPFKTIVANLEERSGMGGEGYLRWLYTAFSAPQQNLHLINVPHKHPFKKTEWEFDQSRLCSTIQPSNLIGYDPSAPIPDDIGEHPTDCREIRNLYAYIVSRTQQINVSVTNLLHHRYQEVYSFKKDQSMCTLQLNYNAKFEVTRIGIRQSEPLSFAEMIRSILTSEPYFYNSFQIEIFEMLQKKFDPFQIKITAVEHHDFQENYFIEGVEGKARIRAYYNKNAAVTKIVISEYSSEKFLFTLKSMVQE